MSYAERFLNDFIDGKLLNLHTAMPCRVIDYDEAARRATIQPLLMTKEVGRPPEALTPIQSVPVVSQKYREGGQVVVRHPVYEQGDIVLVAFCERAIGAVLAGKGRPVLPDSTRHHDINDAVILGVIG